MYADGYKYWFAFKTDKTSYYRCCRYITSKCPGKCTNEDGKIKTTSQHNHPPEPNKALVDKFRKTLTNRAATETSLSLYSIYCDEATNRHVEASLLYPFQSAESAMRKARRKKLPQPSNNLNNIIDVLDSTDLFRVHCGNSKDPLYQKTITLDDCICMIFLHRKTIDLLGRIDEVHIDSSFEFIMQNGPSYFLITFHAIQGQVNAPILYCISTAKNQSAYSAIFSYIRDELKLQPNIIISDFNQIVQSTLSYIFPQAILKGNWFHYTDAILNQMCELGLRKELTKGNSASALKMLLVLPLLPPEYMRNGLESLKKWMNEKSILTDGLLNLCDFIENFWLRKYGCEKISIFGTTRIVSNHIKNFNRNLADFIGTQNPVIWVILDSLTQLATKIYVKTSRKLKNLKETNSSKIQLPGKTTINNLNEAIILPMVRNQKRNEIVSETIITTATQVWIKTPVHLRNPLQFLQLISHCINETMYLASLSGTKEHNYLLNSKNLNCSNLNKTNLDAKTTTNNYQKIDNNLGSSNNNSNTVNHSNFDNNIDKAPPTNFETNFNSNTNYGSNNNNNNNNNNNSNSNSSTNSNNNANSNSNNASNNSNNTSNNNSNTNSENFDSNNQNFNHNSFPSNLQNFNNSTNQQHEYNTNQHVYEANQYNTNQTAYNSNHQSYDNLNYKNNSSNTSSNDSEQYKEIITNGSGLITSNGDLMPNWSNPANRSQPNSTQQNSQNNNQSNNHHSQANSYSIQTISHHSNAIDQSNSHNNSCTPNSHANSAQHPCYTSQHSQTNNSILNDSEQNANALIESHLQELQNAPASPSLSIILAEGTFNCASITHQEFLLAQPGQPLDAQQTQQIHSCCFAQNNYTNDQIDNDHSFIFSFNDDNITNTIRPASNQTAPVLHQNLQHAAGKTILNNFSKASGKKNMYNSLEPPPLVFFPSVKRLQCKRTLPILSQPPPLVPIGSNKFKNSSAAKRPIVANKK